MADTGVRMPLGTGGLLRYDEESRSKFKIKPEYIIVMIVLTIIFELALKFLGKS